MGASNPIRTAIVANEHLPPSGQEQASARLPAIHPHPADGLLKSSAPGERIIFQNDLLSAWCRFWAPQAV